MAQNDGNRVASRVDVDDLDDDGTQTLYQDRPFTGVAVETHPQGHVVAETDYRGGLQLGRERTYHPDGGLSAERHFGPWGLDGLAREWYPDGALKSETVYESGIQVSKKEWDEHGGLLAEKRLTEGDPQYARLHERRAHNPAGSAGHPPS